MFPNLYLVILNWNLKEITHDCLESLLNADILPEQIILVDNGSTDGSVNWFQSQFSGKIHTIENSQNLGFAFASNQGIECALQQGAEWVMLLNNDTIVEKDFFEKLYQAHQDHPSYAILGPLILFYSNPSKIWYLGSRQLWNTLLTRNLYHGIVLPLEMPNLIPVDYLSGCAMLIRREVLEKVGMFNPDLIAYAEEVELCLKARRAGYKLAAVTTARMWHRVSLTADRQKIGSRYLRIRNQIRFYRRYSRGVHYLFLILFTFMRINGIFLADIIKRKQLKLVKPTIAGWWDGWFAPPDLWDTYETR